jgi:hypothetical protein
MRYDAAAFLDSLFRAADPVPAQLPAEWFEFWQERTSIMVMDGKMSLEWAEATALTETLRAMGRAGERPGQ